MLFSDDPSKLPDPETMKAMARQAVLDMYTPIGVKAAVKQAVILCWLIQPEVQRTAAQVGALVRAAVEEVLVALEADPKAFGVSALPPFTSAEQLLSEEEPPST
jgi:hypothetical protein